MLRPTREPRGDDRFFEVKVILLIVGASLGLAGMLYNNEWLIWAALAVVAAAIILRLVVNRKRMRG